MPTPRALEADPRKAFRAQASKLAKRARTKKPAAAQKLVAQLARHGDTLPAAWRKLLVEMADEAPLADIAAVGLAQVAPHRTMVPPMVRRIAAKLARCEAAQSTDRSWDDEIGLAVLAKCADRRAAAVLTRLLAAPKIAHWDLMLEACVRSRAKPLARAITQWLAEQKKRGVSLKWDGYAEGRRAIRELRR